LFDLIIVLQKNITFFEFMLKLQTLNISAFLAFFENF